MNAVDSESDDTLSFTDVVVCLGIVALVVYLLRLIARRYRRLVPETAEEADLRRLLGAQYPEFVQHTGNHVNDPKFVNLVRYLSDIHPIRYREIALPVRGLTPIQASITLDKALRPALVNADVARQFLQGGSIAVESRRIVTTAGTFIIDGHHRWARLYVFNPLAQIESLDMIEIPDPIAALKAVQLGVTATGQSPVPKTGNDGVNLFAVTPQMLRAYLEQTMTPEVRKVFGELLANQDPIEYLARNVSTLQRSNSPIPNAVSPDLMPQTDDTKVWVEHAVHLPKN
jgi:hypothetical protein